MAIQEMIESVRSGVFCIQILRSNGTGVPILISKGSGFRSGSLLITNDHVIQSNGLPRDSDTVSVFNAEASVDLAYGDLMGRLTARSSRDQFDYIAFDFSNELGETSSCISSFHSFALDASRSLKITNEVALLGYPLEHKNFVCHRGTVSSIFQEPTTNPIVQRTVIQLDASINNANSGGPLICPESGVVLGIVTRKNTGFSGLYGELKRALEYNYQTVDKAGGGGINMGFDVREAFKVGFNINRVVMDELERSANVGIGYAYSIEHLSEQLSK